MWGSTFADLAKAAEEQAASLTAQANAFSENNPSMFSLDNMMGGGSGDEEGEKEQPNNQSPNIPAAAPATNATASTQQTMNEMLSNNLFTTPLPKRPTGLSVVAPEVSTEQNNLIDLSPGIVVSEPAAVHVEIDDAEKQTNAVEDQEDAWDFDEAGSNVEEQNEAVKDQEDTWDFDAADPGTETKNETGTADAAMTLLSKETVSTREVPSPEIATNNMETHAEMALTDPESDATPAVIEETPPATESSDQWDVDRAENEVDITEQATDHDLQVKEPIVEVEYITDIVDVLTPIPGTTVPLPDETSAFIEPDERDFNNTEREVIAMDEVVIKPDMNVHDALAEKKSEEWDFDVTENAIDDREEDISEPIIASNEIAPAVYEERAVEVEEKTANSGNFLDSMELSSMERSRIEIPKESTEIEDVGEANEAKESIAVESDDLDNSDSMYDDDMYSNDSEPDEPNLPKNVELVGLSEEQLPKKITAFSFEEHTVGNSTKGRMESSPIGTVPDMADSQLNQVVMDVVAASEEFDSFLKEEQNSTPNSMDSKSISSEIRHLADNEEEPRQELAMESFSAQYQNDPMQDISSEPGSQKDIIVLEGGKDALSKMRMPVTTYEEELSKEEDRGSEVDEILTGHEPDNIDEQCLKEPRESEHQEAVEPTKSDIAKDAETGNEGLPSVSSSFLSSEKPKEEQMQQPVETANSDITKDADTGNEELPAILSSFFSSVLPSPPPSIVSDALLDAEEDDVSLREEIVHEVEESAKGETSEELSASSDHRMEQFAMQIQRLEENYEAEMQELNRRHKVELANSNNNEKLEAEFREKITDKDSQLHKILRKNEGMELKMNTLKRELEGTQKLLEERNSNIGEAAKTHDRDRQKFEKTYKSMEDAVATKNSEVGQLEDELAKSKKEVEVSNDSYTSLKSRVKVVATELKERRLECRTLQTNVTELTTANTSQSTQIENLQTQMEEQEGGRCDADDNVEQMRDRVAKLEKEVAASEKAVNACGAVGEKAISAYKKKAQSALATANARAAAAINAREEADLEASVSKSAAEEALERARRAENNVKQAVAESEGRALGFEENNIQLTKEFNGTKSTLQTAQLELQSLRKEIDLSDLGRQKLIVEVNNLTNVVESERTHSNSLKEDLIEIKNTNHKLCDEAETLREEVQRSAAAAFMEGHESSADQNGDTNVAQKDVAISESEARIFVLQQELKDANHAIKELKEALKGAIERNSIGNSSSAPNWSERETDRDELLSIGNGINHQGAGGIYSNSSYAPQNAIGSNDSTPLFFAIEKQAELNMARDEITRLANLLGDAESARVDAFDSMQDMQRKMEEAEARMRRYEKMGPGNGQAAQRSLAVESRSTSSVANYSAVSADATSSAVPRQTNTTSGGSGNTNIEYLKNVMLSYLSAKTLSERKGLVPVLSAVLELTAEEQAKAMQRVEESGSLEGVSGSFFESLGSSIQSGQLKSFLS